MSDRNSRLSSPSLATLLAYVDPAAMEARRQKARENFGRGTPIPGLVEVDPTLPTGVAREPPEPDGPSPWVEAEAPSQLDVSALPSAAGPPLTPAAAGPARVAAAAPARPQRRAPVSVIVGVLLGLAVATLAIATPLALGWRPVGKAGAIPSAAVPVGVRPGAGVEAATTATPVAEARGAAAAPEVAAPVAASAVPQVALPAASAEPAISAAPETTHSKGTRPRSAGNDPYADAAVPSQKTAPPAPAPSAASPPSVASPPSAAPPPIPAPSSSAPEFVQ